MAGMKTSNSSWKKQLGQKRCQAAATKAKNNPLYTGLRTAFVGIGSELNGDDAAGVLATRELIRSARLPADFLAIDGGSIPESVTGPLRRFNPDLVILFDAADFGEPPGTIHWLDPDQIGGMSASSHTLPLSVLGGFLETELGCEVEYLGIQPGQLEFAEMLSPEVAQSVAEIVKAMISEFSEKK
jgi:hydrogenase 3 maturation protease